MISKKQFFIPLIVSIITLSGCAVNYNSNKIEKNKIENPVINLNEKKPTKYITISGVAEETKDGYYIDNYIIKEEEILDFNPEYISSEYQGKKLEIVGLVMLEENDCGESEGVISQCRPGNTSYIYDIQSIKILK